MIVFRIIINPYSGLQSYRMQGPGSQSDSDEEQIVIKNIDTGETHSTHVLQQGLTAVKVSPQPWQHYFSSLKKLGDRLLQLVMKREHNNLSQLLQEFPVELTEVRYLGGWTLLHFAVSINDPASADIVLRFGLDVNAETTEMKRTALHEAALNNRMDIVELLVGWGANPNIPDSDRNTPMHFAVDYGYCEVVKSLLASSLAVDLNIRNNVNMTPFNTCRSPEIFQILITYNQKSEKAVSNQSKQTASSMRNARGGSYESRLIVRNSEVVPHNSRADMVERFLSLRQNPQDSRTVVNVANISNGSIISQQSYDEDRIEGSVCSTSMSPNPKRSNKKLKRIGAYLKNSSVKNSFRIASQNIGLMRESIIRTHLENEEVIDNYDKLRKLGSGAFAQVYLVRKKRSSVLLALKAIDKVRVAQDGIRRYLYAEREVLTQIKHPFLLQAKHCLQDLYYLYILIEFCPGGDLQKIVRQKPLNEKIAKTYLCEAALALEELHSHEMLYRDLKAANALLDSQGHLRLADFGLAKKATSSGSFLGSMNYLAPEMLTKDEYKTHGKSLDWYLLGVFAYEMLHGYPPFFSDSRQQFEKRVLHQQPTLDSCLSKQCCTLLLGLLQKNPERRLVGLSALKQSQWLKDIDWTQILERKGEVLKPQLQDVKDLRRKEAIEESGWEGQIDERIEWYENWNYPPRTENHNQ